MKTEVIDDDEALELEDIDAFVEETHVAFGTEYKEAYAGRNSMLRDPARQEHLISLMNKATREKKIFRIKRITEIKREYAMNNKLHLLQKQVEVEDLSILIAKFTEETIAQIERTKRLLVAKVEKALKAHIPRELKATYTKYPHSFIQHPGFLYQSSAFYGGYKMWLKVNIPYYFEQFSEMNILQTNDDYISSKLDKLVEQYYVLKNKLARDEINLALRFDKVKTRLDLLDMGIVYYDEYMKLLTLRNEE